MANWVQRKEEESYVGHLEKMIIQRLQGLDDVERQSIKRSQNIAQPSLNDLSIEMNEELDRLENLIAQEQSRK